MAKRRHLDRNILGEAMSNIQKFAEECKLSCRVLMLNAELTYECKLRIQKQISALLDAVEAMSVLYEDHHDEPEVLAINLGLALKERFEPKFGELLK